MRILYKPHQYTQQRQKEKARWIWPVHLAMEATHYINEGHVVSWDESGDEDKYDRVITDPEGLPFLKLPSPDRHLTKAFDFKYQSNGNYKHRPGTYIQSAAGCWWGKCTFCKECDKKHRLRKVSDVIAEIKECKALGFREIFDDAASFAIGEWRDRFIDKLKPLGVTFSCNMRFGTKPDYKAMKNAGFRMLLYGLESANPKTLSMIHKGIDLSDVVNELKSASSCGLEPHIAYMVSYPWETNKAERNTVKLVRWLLKKGYVKTAQCSVYCPPNRIMNRDKEHLTRKLFSVAFMPEFWYNKFKDLRNIDDLKYLLRSIKEGLCGLWGEK